MNKIGIILYPEQFNSKRITTHPEFEEELGDILERSGYKQRFIKMYRLRLKFLEQYWERCILKSDWFEMLKDAKGLHLLTFQTNHFSEYIFPSIAPRI